jgi:hypothetical protein
MKNYLICFSLLLLGCSYNKQSNKLNDKELDTVMQNLRLMDDTLLTNIKIIDLEKHYSHVKRKTIISDSFKIINIGKKPLVIKGINAACDCTTIEYVKNTSLQPFDTITVNFKIETKDMDQGYNKRSISILGNFYPFYKNVTVITYLID